MNSKIVLKMMIACSLDGGTQCDIAFIHLGKSRYRREIDHEVLEFGMIECKRSVTETVKHLDSPVSQQQGDDFPAHKARCTSHQYHSTVIGCHNHPRFTL